MGRQQTPGDWLPAGHRHSLRGPFADHRPVRGGPIVCYTLLL